MAKKNDSQANEYEEKAISISRVSKKTKGGDQMGFTALMVVGDRKGKVGVGLGKAKDVLSAIQKGTRQAKRKMVTIPIDGTTIPFSITAQHGAGKVLLKPATQGSGVIAGGPVRAVVEAAGIKDISAKILGSDNQASSVHATFQALKDIKRIIKVRGIKVEQDLSDQQDASSAQNPVQEKKKETSTNSTKVVKKVETVKKKTKSKKNETQKKDVSKKSTEAKSKKSSSK
ncbi:MAG: 30S ribosomal protein S5 [Microgenomates bacterium 39_7]|nr:MAG: 30S ribosomal protein S5 [Microgenomates bacterium 39_7]